MTDSIERVVALGTLIVVACLFGAASVYADDQACTGRWIFKVCWTRPGFDEAQWKQDRYECWRDAQAIPSQMVYVQPETYQGRVTREGHYIDMAPRQQAFTGCLEARGYTRVK
jgi:hypothetical protein